MHRGDGVDEACADVQPLVVRDPGRELEIAYVVQGVINCHPLHPIGPDTPDRQLHHVIGVEAEGEQALSASHDVDRRAVHPLGNQPHPPPGILVQVADAHVEDGATLEVDQVETHLVQAPHKGQQHRVRHPRRPQRLLTIARGHIDKPDPTARPGATHEAGSIHSNGSSYSTS